MKLVNNLVSIIVFENENNLKNIIPSGCLIPGRRRPIFGQAK
jgi:hypothetical protein